MRHLTLLKVSTRVLSPVGISGTIVTGGMVKILHFLLCNAMLSSSGFKVVHILSQK